MRILGNRIRDWENSGFHLYVIYEIERKGLGFDVKQKRRRRRRSKNERGRKEKEREFG